MNNLTEKQLRAKKIREERELKKLIQECDLLDKLLTEWLEKMEAKKGKKVC